jgi:hypothetical protein
MIIKLLFNCTVSSPCTEKQSNTGSNILVRAWGLVNQTDDSLLASPLPSHVSSGTFLSLLLSLFHVCETQTRCCLYIKSPTPIGNHKYLFLLFIICTQPTPLKEGDEISRNSHCPYELSQRYLTILTAPWGQIWM